MMEAGVSVVPGTKEPVFDAEKGKEIADAMGYPVIVKASSGGGGKGMRIVHSSEEFIQNFNTAQRESINAFADDTMYIEKYIVSPRHIEFQILADKHGNVVHLGERDCSVQRRHQKLLEESPSVAIQPELRRKMGEQAVLAAKAVHYQNAGTIEFLLDKNGDFYFMEMNTRIQVEHPVTEMVTGIDLIKEQIRIAEGRELSFTQEDVRISGHAIECRINAEDPDKNFMPCPGRIAELHIPGGNGVRIDTALYQDYDIPPYYDSMLMKVIVHGQNRMEAINKMRSVLGEIIIDGVTTNLDFQYEIINNPDFNEGNISTHFIQDAFDMSE